MLYKYTLLFAAGRKVFREFLRSEYSEENMLFWLACEEIKREDNPEVVEEKARNIYEDYISILSPKEVCTHYQLYVVSVVVYRNNVQFSSLTNHVCYLHKEIEK